ncbi:hypothetical protein BDN67DRAFT_496343 [Paxillus ammoniavirescens]|nr:hypothetical protein BDN67DRAFT_496343 [Paxillus ammoniavirescens]
MAESFVAFMASEVKIILGRVLAGGTSCWAFLLHHLPTFFPFVLLLYCVWTLHRHISRQGAQGITKNPAWTPQNLGEQPNGEIFQGLDDDEQSASSIHCKTYFVHTHTRWSP